MEPKQSCGKCSSAIGELREGRSTVSCNGPCRKTFHALCANLDLTLFNTCTGLLWFCQSCRLDFGEEARYRRSVLQDTVQRMLGELQKLADRVQSLDGDAKQLPAIPAVKRRIVADSNDSKRKCNGFVGESTEGPRKCNPQFPEKIWAKVFENLNFADLCHARLTSGQWKKIVDGCLMSKFILKIANCEELKIDPPIPSIPSLPASTIVVESSRILAVGSWWCPTITEKLVNLELCGCNISLTILFSMLRHTPNLVSLSLIYHQSNLIYEETASEFSELRLEKMLNLTLSRVQQDEVLAMFSRMCPQLKYFALNSDYHECFRGVLEMIQVVPSLEEISLVSSSNDLCHLAGVNHQFKRVSIAITTYEGAELKGNLIRFSGNQPFLECLKLEIRGNGHNDATLNSKDLNPMFQNLLKLKHLSIKFGLFCNLENDIIDLPSIGCLNELKYLEINGDTKDRTFSIPVMGNPKLRELCLKYIEITPESRDYIANAPNLRIITLILCPLYDNSDLFTAIRWEDLRCLKLDTVAFPSSDEFRLCDYIDGLRCMELRRCSVDKRFLVKMFSLCSRLEELCLKEMENVRDSVVLESFQKMKHLRKLTFSKCSITDHSARHIAEHALNLKQLTIKSCEKLTNEGVTQLKGSKIAALYIN